MRPITFRLPPRFVQNFLPFSLSLSFDFIYKLDIHAHHRSHIWTQFHRLMKWMHCESMLFLCLIRYRRYCERSSAHSIIIFIRFNWVILMLPWKKCSKKYTTSIKMEFYWKSLLKIDIRHNMSWSWIISSRMRNKTLLFVLLFHEMKAFLLKDRRHKTLLSWLPTDLLESILTIVHFNGLQ